jgi:hypothetical protein
VTPHRLDDIILAVAIILPVWLVLRWDYRSIFVGAAFVWAMLILAGRLLNATVPDRGFNLDTLWILVGWLPCLVSCALLYAVKLGVLRAWRARVKWTRAD